MKKVILILTMILALVFNSFSFAASGEQTESTGSEAVTQNETVELKSEDNNIEDVTPASQKILENSSKKERKIAEYREKYNDEFYANVAYWLDVIQRYSIPVCIIGITIGAFNFYIIGEKKLDKREKGFSFIMSFLCGLVFFQVLPLIFALFVAGK